MVNNEHDNTQNDPLKKKPNGLDKMKWSFLTILFLALILAGVVIGTQLALREQDLRGKAAEPTPTPAPGLISNLKDPGLTLDAWQTIRAINGVWVDGPDNSCKHTVPGPNYWLINSVDVDSRICDNPTRAIKAVWNEIGTPNQPKKSLTLSIDNALNRSDLRCTQDRNYLGFSDWYGYKKLLYEPQLEKFVVRVKIKNEANGTDVCETGSCNPQCQPDPGRLNPNGYGWSTLFIGIPMYDEAKARNLWVELVVYTTKYGRQTNNPNVLFYGEAHEANNNQEFWRIDIAHPANTQDKAAIAPGQSHYYDLDVLQIIRNLAWKNQYIGVPPGDWSKVHLAGAYIGTEIWGDAKQNFTVSDFDVLYQVKPLPDQSPIGWLDGALVPGVNTPPGTCGVYGWTCDPDKTQTSLTVDIFSNNAKVAETVANASRPDVPNAGFCNGNSKVGFFLTLPYSSGLYDGQSHGITAKARSIDASGNETGLTVPLSMANPVSVTCPASTPTPVPLPGDLDHDGDVDLYDFNLFLADFGKTGAPGFTPADIDKSGKVDIFDYNILVGNFGSP